MDPDTETACTNALLKLKYHIDEAMASSAVPIERLPALAEATRCYVEAMVMMSHAKQQAMTINNQTE